MENLVPQLRFSLFTKGWVNSKLGDLGVFKGGGTPSTNKKTYWKGDIPWISSSDITENDIFNINIKRYISNEAIDDSATKIITANSVLFVARVGIGKLAVSKVKLCTSQDFANLQPKKDNSIFIAYYFLSKVKLLHQYAQGTSIKGFTTGDLKSIPIILPSIPEQQKIASFLSDVDKVITKLTKKKELLEQYKKGIMQKIFNQELRFKDENGSKYPNWEEKQLRDVANYRRGSFPQPYGLPKWYDKANGIPFVQVYDVDDNMLLKPITKHRISLLGAKQSVFVEKGTLIITIQGSIGRIAKTQYDAYIDRTLLIFQSYKKPLNIDYFKYVLFLLFEIEKRKAPGGIIKTITKEVLSSFNVMIPSMDEQTKIANFLSDIDLKIEALNNKIEDSKKFKKGLLQKMFV
jgi:type I restriction enzyme S subunit